MNLKGFQAIVTTTGVVTPRMAAQYFDLLDKRLVSHPSLSMAHFYAVQQLKQAKPADAFAQSYGLKALIFTLLGDGSLKVCPLSP